MLYTDRLIITPLSEKELSMYVESPEELAAQLGLQCPVPGMEPQLDTAIREEMLPKMAAIPDDSLFCTLWLMILKKKMAIAGSICFHGPPDSSGCVEIGYGTNDEFRNLGLMTEAVAEMLRWLSASTPVKTVIAETDNINAPSLRVLQKNGFLLDKTIENAVFMKKELHQPV
jgi:RimJ/RimL family protein N-acetyltransferase